MVLEPLFLKTLEHHVLLEREVEDKTVLVAILGNVAHACGALIMDARFRYVLPAERYAAAGGFLKTGYAVD